MPNQYRMSINLNVLRHLGLNLYSNVPAVIAEAVANAWDADATEVEVEIHIAEDRIVVSDNGSGMTVRDANDRYLHVGYQRRSEPGMAMTPSGRAVMGRKGIGKLSLMSIAKRIEVHSFRDGEKHGFVLEADKIEQAIEDDGEYKPEPVVPSSIDLAAGTRIILNDLKRRIRSQTTYFVRRRLARRFSIIGAAQGFKVKVNGEAIGPSDRGYYDKLQYVWHLGEKPDWAENHANIVQATRRNGAIDPGTEDIPPSLLDADGRLQVTGWIGTARRSQDLQVDGDNINKIVLMVRGKMAQEDLLEELGETGLYTKYVIGEIHADFLDADEADDIATSSRQRIIEDDPRYVVLRRFARNELKAIQTFWLRNRREAAVDEAIKIPAIRTWLDSLTGDFRRSAEELLGKVNQLTMDTPAQHAELFKQSVLAFEILRHKQSLDALESVSAENIPAFTQAFKDVDDLEATLYYQIVKDRIRLIEKLRSLVEKDAREKLLQEHLFDHLWLLDPSWERATDEEFIESQLKTRFPVMPDDPDFEESSRGRVDIGLKMTAGQYVLVELKRAGRKLRSGELLEQVRTYGTTLRQLLKANNAKNTRYEIVCVVGSPLADVTDSESEAEIEVLFDGVRARVTTYQSLIDNAYRAYAEYIERARKAERLARLLEEIEIDVDALGHPGQSAD